MGASVTITPFKVNKPTEIGKVLSILVEELQDSVLGSLLFGFLFVRPSALTLGLALELAGADEAIDAWSVIKGHCDSGVIGELLQDTDEVIPGFLGQPDHRSAVRGAELQLCLGEHDEGLLLLLGGWQAWGP